MCSFSDTDIDSNILLPYGADDFLVVNVRIPP